MQYWRIPRLEDIDYIYENMRDADVLEVKAQGRHPHDALYDGYFYSKVCYTLVTPEGEPIAMAGVVPSEVYKGFGAVWLLGTPAIEDYGYRFLRHSKTLLQEFYDKTGYEAFYNATHKDNHVHHRWLSWLGFTFLRRLTIGNSGFIEFVRLRGG